MNKCYRKTICTCLLVLTSTLWSMAANDSFVEYTKQPEYPTDLKGSGIMGDVTIAAKVGNDGAVKELQVLQSSGNSELDTVAMDALSLWRFYPLLKNGIPQEFQYQAHFHFEDPGKDLQPAVPDEGTNKDKKKG